jgi:hypothetical protein
LAGAWLATTHGGRHQEGERMDIQGFGAFGPQQMMPQDKETFGAQVVKQTMDNLNTNVGGEKNADYAFQTSVLNAGALGKGLYVNKMV